MSNDILLTTQVEVFFFLEFILFCIVTLSSYIAFKIVRSWDFSSTTSSQYTLEKQSYFVNLTISFSLLIKIFLLFYFIYSVDLLASIVPGAMCAAGVITANNYGENLLILKVVVVFLSLLWMLINSLDLRAKDFPYMKKKLSLFLLIYLLLVVEFVVDIFYFSNISTESLATCCSILYAGNLNTTLPFDMDISTLLSLFYLLFVLILIANYKQNSAVTFILNIFFIYISYFAIVYFFGTYIYELPTHHCPFCMLQYDYNYIGYFIFISLFLGVFFGVINFILKLITQKISKKYFYYSSFFIFLFVAICSLYVIVYYLQRGVFL